LPWLIRHSKRTLSIIRQNIWFSLGVKLIFVVLAFAGFATLWAAIAADMCGESDCLTIKAAVSDAKLVKTFGHVLRRIQLRSIPHFR
jgi:hypothetical protein